MPEQRTRDDGEAGTRRVSVEWQPGAAPVAGLVRLDTGAVRPFAGWIELMAVLQEAVATGAPGTEEP